MDRINPLNYIQNPNTILSIGTVILNMAVTVMVAVFIFWVYKKTFTGVMYSKNFNLTLLLTSMVTAMVMMVIGTNLALSLGMVGALSIVRFRSAIKDPRDIGFLFWGISAGLAAGTQAHIIAIIGSLFIAVILFIFNRTSFSDLPFLLVLKGGQIDEEHVRYILKDLTDRYALRMRNSSSVQQELVYEVRFPEGGDRLITERLSQLENIKAINIISHRGELSG